MDAETLKKLLDMYHLDFVLFGYDLTEMDDIILQKIKVKIIEMIKNQTTDKATSNYAFFENTVYCHNLTDYYMDSFFYWDNF